MLENKSETEKLLDAIKIYLSKNGQLEDYSIQTLYDRALSHCIEIFGSSEVVNFWPKPDAVKRYIKNIRAAARGPVDINITAKNQSVFKFSDKITFFKGEEVLESIERNKHLIL